MASNKNTCFAFIYLIFCGVREKKTAPKIPDSEKVKIRVGFDGKDTLMDPHNINIKTMFGNFAVLLDSNNQVVPLNSEGFVAGDPLDPRKRYVVVVNTHGSSKTKWDILKNNGGKHHHKPHSSKKKSSKKDKKKSSKKEKKDVKDSIDGGGEEMKLIAANGGGGDDDFTTKDFGISSTEHLLTSSSDEDI